MPFNQLIATARDRILIVVGPDFDVVFLRQYTTQGYSEHVTCLFADTGSWFL